MNTYLSTHPESDGAELLRVDEQPAVEHERRLVHARIDRLPVDLLELLPLRGDHDRLRVLARLERALRDGHLLLDCADKLGISLSGVIRWEEWVKHTIGKGGRGAGLLEVEPDLLLRDLGVVHVHEGLLRLEVLDERDRCRFAGVTGVSLEGEAEHSNAL